MEAAPRQSIPPAHHVALPFAKRLSLIAANLLLYQAEHRFPPELVEIALRAVKALPGWERLVPDNVL